MTSKIFPAVVLSIMALFLTAPMLVQTSCSGPGSLRNIEEMDEGQMASAQAKTDLIVRVLAARLVKEGATSAGSIQDAATYLEIAAGDPLATAGPHALTDALKRVGFSDQEAMLALVLVEDFLRSRFDFGLAANPLGPNARAMMMTVANALRMSVVGVTKQEQAAADAEIEAVISAR